MAIAIALTFNVSIAKSGDGSSVDLNTISSTPTAQAECFDLQGWEFCCRYYTPYGYCLYTNARYTECSGC